MRAMRWFCGLVAVSSGLALVNAGRSTASQYTGILQSAETVDKGNVKITIAPLFVFEKDEVDSEFGASARLGYGFTERLDAEAKLGFLENHTMIGADLEIWVVGAPTPDSGLDLSLTGGLHYVFASDDMFDSMGFELTPQGSIHLGESFELCGALAFGFESLQDVPEGIDDSYTLVHAVPGFEYKLSEEADLEAEVGIAVNDDSYTYAAAGFTFYLR